MATEAATPPPGEEGGSKFNSWGRATSAEAGLGFGIAAGSEWSARRGGV